MTSTEHYMDAMDAVSTAFPTPRADSAGIADMDARVEGLNLAHRCHFFRSLSTSLAFETGSVAFAAALDLAEASTAKLIAGEPS